MRSCVKSAEALLLGLFCVCSSLVFVAILPDLSGFNSPNAALTMNTATPASLRVLYDGGCPLCRREIAHYQRLHPRQPIQWVDIAADPRPTLPFNLTIEQVMQRFHVLDGEHVLTGAAAFVRLWSALPGWWRLARLVRQLRLVGLLEHGYVWFARRRWRQRCREGVCQTGPHR